MKIILLVSSLFVSVGYAYGQAQLPCESALERLDKYFVVANDTSTNQGEIRTPSGRRDSAKNWLLSQRSLNKFVAQKQAYYLSGTNNLSLYENFAISSVTEGKLQLGHNFVSKLEEEQVDKLYTVALQTNIANNFANLFAEQKLANDLGIVLRYTNFLGTRTFLHGSPTQIAAMNKRRKLRLQQLQIRVQAQQTQRAQQRQIQLLYDALQKLQAQQMAAEPREQERRRLQVLQDSLRTLYQSAGYDLAPYLAEAQQADCEEQAKQAVTDFFAHELIPIEEGHPGNGYNSFRTAWWSFQAFLPITSTTYQVATDTTAPMRKESLRNWSGAVNYGSLREGQAGTLFFNARAKIFNNSTIGSKNPAMTQFNQYVFAPGAARSSLSDDATTVYVGNYREFYTAALEGQAIFFFKSKQESKVGVSLLVEQNFGHYDALNVQFGVPFFLKGEDKESGVNVELQAKLPDVRGSFNPDLDLSDKIALGLSVSLPFGSIVH